MIPPVFILVRPQMGENIGAAARAMLNFGLDRMRIVAPRDGWPNPKANAMASGAGRVLDNAGLFPDVARSIADCDFVFATTARSRELVKPVVTPERAMEMIRAIDQNRLKPVIAETYPLESMVEGFQFLESQRHFGKICLSF